jgi:RND superfamily putative drug exporter
VGNSISGRPRMVWIGTAAALAVLCLGFFRLDTGGIPSDEQYTTDQDSVTGQAILVEHGLVDASTPIQVVANADQAEDVVAAMEGIDGIAQPVVAATEGDTALIVADITSDPYSEEALNAVEDVRDAVHEVDGADALTTGISAVTLDIMEASARDNKVIIPIVLVVVFLILVGLLRALTAPLILIGTVILSFGAALGISALLFEFVFGFAGSDPGFPLFAFVFLVALGIDYNIFLMSRVREESVHHGTRDGVLRGLIVTGGVITSAGVVLAATFSALAVLPLVILVELGVAVAVGVLLDTIVVRSLLVPALAHDIGDPIWWPSRLARGHKASHDAGDRAESLLGEDHDDQHHAEHRR